MGIGDLKNDALHGMLFVCKKSKKEPMNASLQFCPNQACSARDKTGHANSSELA
jgi:hypothetical protein